MSTSSSLSRLKELLPQLFQPSQTQGDRYLRFQLTPKVSGLISMSDVQESLLVSGYNITPIPNMSASVMGLMSSRNRVFCVVDLAELTGISSLSPYLEKYHTIVLNVSKFVAQQVSSTRELFLAIAINRVEGIMPIMPEQMQSLKTFSQWESDSFLSSLTPYIHSYIVNKEQPLFVFDTLAIINQTYN